ncbi:hypothetical protein WAK64_05750 [Bacillus spongiae]|uniref:Uncharacterized protein n=1 Tax=Bacillus spongiae TaxID=2683610 RepID=A0ABU8HBB5_9BACI
MGYMLPYPKYVYQQYAVRDIPNDYDPYNIIKVTRTSLQKLNSNDVSQENFQRKTYTITSTKEISPHVLADLTGKGKYINKSI